jgi:hypothetical protein
MNFLLACIDPRDIPRSVADPGYLIAHPELLSKCEYTLLHVGGIENRTTSAISFCYEIFGKEYIGSPTQQEYLTLVKCEHEGLDLMIILNPVSFTAFSLMFMVTAFALDWYFKLGIFRI